MRVHVVANPTAGRGATPRLLAGLERALAELGATTTVHLTSGPGDAQRHVGALEADALDRLVVLGGDGTLHEAVNAKEGALPWPVGLVPLGTANLVARDARVPLRGPPERWAQTVVEGTPWAVDLLGTDRGRALAVAGVGLDAEIVAAVARARRGGMGGYFRWIGPIVGTLLDHAPARLRVVVDGKTTIEGAAVVVQNTFCYGGLFSLAREARMDDGRLEVVVLQGGRRRDHFRLLLSAYAGRVAHDRFVRMAAGTSVEIFGEAPTAVQVDGDPAGTTPLRARVLPRALTLLRPPPSA